MTPFICPVCKSGLTRKENTLRCARNHCYDIARQGYVNLLMSQRPSEKRHGDDRLMVRSRSAFLDRGFYAPLRDKIVETAQAYAPERCLLLDAGCGEGYYTATVYAALEDRAASVAGVDISREALIAAAGRCRSLELAVASLYAIPVADDSCDILLNIFAPFAAEEFVRVLKPGGVVVRAAPLPRHLFGLKAAVYDRPYENETEIFETGGLVPVENTEIHGRICLFSQEDIGSLFKMTPYYYKTGVSDQARLAGLTDLETEIAFGVTVFRKPY